MDRKVDSVIEIRTVLLCTSSISPVNEKSSDRRIMWSPATFLRSLWHLYVAWTDRISIRCKETSQEATIVIQVRDDVGFH